MDEGIVRCESHTLQEDLIFTELSREPKLIEFYNSKEKRDGHSFVAKMCFPEILKDTPEQQVKSKFPELRSQAKKAKFAIHYGGNGATIAKNLSLPIELGLSIEKAYLSNFDGIAAYFKKVKREAWDKGYILLSPITRHKYYIYGWEELREFEKTLNSDYWDTYRIEKSKKSALFENVLSPKIRKHMQVKSEVGRHALNYPVQGSSAILTKVAGVFFFDWLIKNNLLFKVLICNAVHDELLVETKIEYADKVAKALQNAMEYAGTLFCKVVKLKAVPEIATFWKH